MPRFRDAPQTRVGRGDGRCALHALDAAPAMYLSPTPPGPIRSEWAARELRHHSFPVGMSTDMLDDPAAAFQHEQTRDQVVEKGSIVTHHQQRSLEFPEALPRAPRAFRGRDRSSARRAGEDWPGGANSRARRSRFRSPPDNARTGSCARTRGEQEVLQVPEDVDRLAAPRSGGLHRRALLRRPVASSGSRSRSWSKYAI